MRTFTPRNLEVSISILPNHYEIYSPTPSISPPLRGHRSGGLCVSVAFSPHPSAPSPTTGAYGAKRFCLVSTHRGEMAIAPHHYSCFFTRHRPFGAPTKRKNDALCCAKFHLSRHHFRSSSPHSPRLARHPPYAQSKGQRKVASLSHRQHSLKRKCCSDCICHRTCSRVCASCAPDWSRDFGTRPCHSFVV